MAGRALGSSVGRAGPGRRGEAGGGLGEAWGERELGEVRAGQSESGGMG
jgi:hypothetical protein